MGSARAPSRATDRVAPPRQARHRFEDPERERSREDARATLARATQRPGRHHEEAVSRVAGTPKWRARARRERRCLLRELGQDIEAIHAVVHRSAHQLDARDQIELPPASFHALEWARSVADERRAIEQPARDPTQHGGRSGRSPLWGLPRDPRGAARSPSPPPRAEVNDRPSSRVAPSRRRTPSARRPSRASMVNALVKGSLGLAAGGVPGTRPRTP